MTSDSTGAGNLPATRRLSNPTLYSYTGSLFTVDKATSKLKYDSHLLNTKHVVYLNASNPTNEAQSTAITVSVFCSQVSFTIPGTTWITEHNLIVPDTVETDAKLKLGDFTTNSASDSTICPTELKMYDKN
jgi:hypothetical protein